MQFLPAHQTYISNRIEKFGRVADLFWLSLFVLLFVDALSSPYAGLIYDARLYSLQALFHLYPGRYEKDLFFIFGSQDSFTVFSVIHAFFIKYFSLYDGTWLLYWLSKSALYASLLLFLREFLVSKALALVVAVLIAAGPAHYIAFEVNEPFLTARLASEALSLLALTFLLRNDFVKSIIFLLLSLLLHPLMALPAGCIMVMWWFWYRQWRFVVVLMLASVLTLLLFYLRDPTLHAQINLTATFDDEWRDAVLEFGSCLVPGLWSRADIYSLVGSLLLSIFALAGLTTRQKRMVLSIGATTVIGVCVTLLSVYVLEFIIGVQVQLWRAFWLLRILVPALAVLWGRYLWSKADYFEFRLASCLVVIPVIINGTVYPEGIIWLVFAQIVILLPRKFWALISLKTENLLFVILLLFFMFSSSVVAYENLSIFFDNRNIYSMLFSLFAGAEPFIRPFVLLIMSFLPQTFWVTFVIFFSYVVVSLPGRVPGYHYPDSISLYRPDSLPTQTQSIVRQWRKWIPSGSVVLTDGLVSVSDIWFLLEASCYTSRAQKGGLAFNRSLAMEFVKRNEDSSQLFTGDIQNADLVSWSRDRDIDFIITTRDFPLRKCASVNHITLYSVKGCSEVKQK